MSVMVLHEQHLAALVGSFLQIKKDYTKIEDPADLARLLYAANVRSYTHKYPKHAADGDGALPVSAQRMTAMIIAWQRAPLSIGQFLKALFVYEYQACEAPNWHDSEAFKMCELMRHEAAERLPDYASCPYGIEEPPAPATVADAPPVVTAVKPLDSRRPHVAARPLELNRAAVAALNGCGRYLSVDVLRPEREHAKTQYDHKHVHLVPCPAGNHGSADIERMKELGIPFTVYEVLPPPATWDACRPRVKIKGETRSPQAGSAFLETGDSRFRDTYGAPIALHDHFDRT